MFGSIRNKIAHFWDIPKTKIGRHLYFNIRKKSYFNSYNRDDEKAEKTLYFGQEELRNFELWNYLKIEFGYQ